MSSYNSKAWFTLAVLALANCPSASAQSPEAEVNAYAVKAPISGIPTSAYSEWTETQRQSTFGKVRGFCQFLCVDKYATAAFPDKAAADRTATTAKVCLEACIVAHLPADYPQLADLTEQLRADYGKAKQLGSAIPWPLPGK
jgi:hypothetical protein